MRSLTQALAAAMVGATLIATPVLAREDMDSNLFVKMADKDGMVSKAELMKHVEKMLDKADTRKDGKLDKQQVETFLRELMKSGA
jgi:hypothetical protein